MAQAQAHIQLPNRSLEAIWFIGGMSWRRSRARAPVESGARDYRYHPLNNSATAAAEAPDADDEDRAAAPAVETRTVTVPPAWHGWRLDKALVALASEFSRSHLQSLIDAGALALDGRIERRAARRLQAGQGLSLELRPTDESRAYVAQAMHLAIVHEDEHVLVIDKPAGLVVHPGAGHWSGTLLNGLLAHHAAAATLPRAGIVHRLDKDTSGVMVVAKSLPAHAALVRAIAERSVKRHYLALAHGVWPASTHEVNAPIGRDPVVRVRMAVVPASAGGREARTDVARIAVADDVSALACSLHTGRTHQIRVHAAHSGCPLVGDTTYGGKPALGLARQALHAAHLAFEHPESARPMAFEVPAPADFAAAWRAVTGRPARWKTGV